MLKQLREKTKTILWFVVVAFVLSIFAIWGMNLRSPESRNDNEFIVGRVNGNDIDAQDYINMYNQLYAEMKARKGEEAQLTQIESGMLVQQAWEQLIHKILVTEEINRLEISVTDDELVGFLRSNPHPNLQQAFRNEEGQFDYESYLEALSDPSMDWTNLEKWGLSVLPELKIETYLSSRVHVPQREIVEKFEIDNVRFKAEYVEIPFETDESSYEPSEEEIVSIYEKTKSAYKEPEKKRVRLVEIKKDPTDDDEKEIFERLLEIKQDIIAGKDFSKAAKDFSDDPGSASKGGDLGFIGRGEMVEEFENTAFSLDEGQISDPIRTEFGYHIIKAGEKKTEDGAEKLHVSHILMKVDPGYETMDSLNTVIGEIKDEIAVNGLEGAAAAFGLEIREIPPFTQYPFIGELGYMPRVVNFAFNHERGDISSRIDNESSAFFIEILETIPEAFTPLEEVRSQLVERIRRDRAKEITREKARTMRQRILSGGTFEEVAESEGLEVKETPFFSENEPVPGIGNNNAFTIACSLMPPGQITPPVTGRNSCYLIRVMERTEIDPEQFRSTSTDIRNGLLGEMANGHISSWYVRLKENADIDDLRERPIN